MELHARVVRLNYGADQSLFRIRPVCAEAIPAIRHGGRGSPLESQRGFAAQLRPGCPAAGRLSVDPRRVVGPHTRSPVAVDQRELVSVGQHGSCSRAWPPEMQGHKKAGRGTSVRVAAEPAWRRFRDEILATRRRTADATYTPSCTRYSDSPRTSDPRSKLSLSQGRHVLRGWGTLLEDGRIFFFPYFLFCHRFRS